MKRVLRDGGINRQEPRVHIHLIPLKHVSLEIEGLLDDGRNVGYGWWCKVQSLTGLEEWFATCEGIFVSLRLIQLRMSNYRCMTNFPRLGKELWAKELCRALSMFGQESLADCGIVYRSRSIGDL